MIPAPHTPWRLRRGTRRVVLVIHIMAGGAWFGLDVAMAVLIFTAIATDSTAVRAHTLQSLALVTVWPMFTAAVLSLVTGVLLGLGSKYGLFRYWWVVVKLGLNLVLGTLIVASLRGGVIDAADFGRRLALGTDLDWDFADLLYPATVSPTALTVAFILSVVKPWGRIRSRADARPAFRPDSAARVGASSAHESEE